MVAFAIFSAHADEQSPEDRLRAALRQSVEEMRAAQDNAAGLQAQLATAQQQQQALQAQLDAANAKLAQTAGKPTAKPEETAALQAQLQSARAESAEFHQGLAKWQGAYQQAVGIAQSKNAESEQAQAGLRANGRALETCKAANRKLIDVSEQVLHLYQSQSFHSVLLRSYEPLIGSAKVELENLVQDYDDKIRDQEYVPPKPAAGRSPAMRPAG